MDHEIIIHDAQSVEDGLARAEKRAPRCIKTLEEAVYATLGLHWPVERPVNQPLGVAVEYLVEEGLLYVEGISQGVGFSWRRIGLTSHGHGGLAAGQIYWKRKAVAASALAATCILREAIVVASVDAPIGHSTKRTWHLMYLGAFVSLGIENAVMAEQLAVFTGSDEEAIGAIGVLRDSKEDDRVWPALEWLRAQHQPPARSGS